VRHGCHNPLCHIANPNKITTRLIGLLLAVTRGKETMTMKTDTDPIYLIVAMLALTAIFLISLALA
jgi:hypothetical protein